MDLTKQFRIICYFLVTVALYAIFPSKVTKGLFLCRGYKNRVMNLNIHSPSSHTYTQYDTQSIC